MRDRFRDRLQTLDPPDLRSGLLELAREIRIIRNWLIAVAFVCFAVGGAALIIAGVNLSQTIGINTVEPGGSCETNLQCDGGVCSGGKCRPPPVTIGGPCPGPRDMPAGLVCRDGQVTLPHAGDACTAVGCGDGSTCHDNKCVAD